MAGYCFLVCHILPLFSLVAAQAIQYGQKGSETTLAPRIPGTPDKILWKQAFRRVVEFDGSEESVHGTFRDRVVLDWHTASLTVRDLQGSDSGSYELEATINNKKYYSQHEVAVIDKVAVPTISCLINGSDDSAGDAHSPRTLAMLKCVAEGPPSLLSYSWTLPSGAHPGPELPVVLEGKQDETVYSCRAANPVSQETGTFVAKDCYPDTFSTTALIISLIVLGLLIVLIAGCFVGYRRWKKAHPEPKYSRDAEEQPLKLSNGPDHGGAYGQDNGATLPSTQRLPLLSHDDLAPRPGSDQGEGDPTGSGRWGDATLVRQDSTEPKPPESPQPTDPGSEGSAGDLASEPEQPDLESECSLPPPASPAGRGGHLAAAEPDATQTLKSTNTGAQVQPPGEPERRLEDEPPPSEGPQVVLVSGSPQDAAPLCWSSTSPEDLQSASAETTDHTANSSPSPTQLEPASGALLDSETRPPPLLAPQDGHLSSDEGSPAARANPVTAIPLREENEVVAPLSCHSSSEEVRGEEEEEKEEQRKDSGGGCSSAGEDLAADDDPNGSVVAPADTRGTRGESDEDPSAEDSWIKPEATERREEEEGHRVPETSHEDPRVPVEDEMEEDDNRVVAGLRASEPEAHGGSEEEDSLAGHSREEDASHTPEDKQDLSEDGAGQGTLPAEPATETPERTEEEEGDLPHDEAEGEGGGDGENVVAQTPGGPEGVAEETLAGPSTEEDVQTPVRKHEHEEGPQELGQEEDAGREDERTSPTQTESGPESGPDPDPEREGAAAQEETHGPRGNEEETKDQTGDGSSPDHEDGEQTERRDGQKEARRDTIPE